MGQNEMSTLYREHSIDASYQVSIHLAKRFQRRFLEIDQPETITAYGYSVSEVNIFQKSTNQQYEVPVVAMFVNGSCRTK
jgi:hypothetical protein